MNRRRFIGGAAALAAGARVAAAEHRTAETCGCDPLLFQASPEPADSFRDFSSGLKVTNLKTFGVSLTPQSDRPYVFVKLETNQGLVGWGEGTLEGKAQAAMSCIEDFRDFVIGKDPMQVEHHWQSMYVHSFYRAGPVMGSAISGIDQALWDLRGKALNVPVYQLLGAKGLLSNGAAATTLPPVGTTLISGDLGFRQHPGGHTALPNWPTFIEFASRYLPTPPQLKSTN